MTHSKKQIRATSKTLQIRSRQKSLTLNSLERLKNARTTWNRTRKLLGLQHRPKFCLTGFISKCCFTLIATNWSGRKRISNRSSRIWKKSIRISETSTKWCSLTKLSNIGRLLLVLTKSILYKLIKSSLLTRPNHQGSTWGLSSANDKRRIYLMSSIKKTKRLIKSSTGRLPWHHRCLETILL